MSRSPLARGLSRVNTDMMSVGTRYGSFARKVPPDWSLIWNREKMYSQGGIFSITSRILIVDLLSCTQNVYSWRSTH